MNKWIIHEKIGKYWLWSRAGANHKVLWNVTTTQVPPSKDSGGYYDKDELFKLKGIKIDKL